MLCTRRYNIHCPLFFARPRSVKRSSRLLRCSRLGPPLKQIVTGCGRSSSPILRLLTLHSSHARRSHVSPAPGRRTRRGRCHPVKPARPACSADSTASGAHLSGTPRQKTRRHPVSAGSAGRTAECTLSVAVTGGAKRQDCASRAVAPTSRNTWSPATEDSTAEETQSG